MSAYSQVKGGLFQILVADITVCNGVSKQMEKFMDINLTGV
jgi:hypothetical protein